MKKIRYLTLLCIATGLVALSCTQKSAEPTVVCENGQFVGYVEDNGVFAFKGIPFAKAPVGELRWKAPQPVEASDEVFEAKTNVTIFGETAGYGDVSRI